MKNDYLNGSADGMAEDIIRAICQLGASELHAKTNYEKANAELENGLIDVEDPDVLAKQLAKLERIREDINIYAELRRKAMLTLYELYENENSDKEMWCMVKHLGMASTTLFEAYQGSDNDLAILTLAVDTNKAFVKALSEFLGAEVTDCASCISDYLKAKE